MKVGNLGGAYRHNERIFKNHSNKDIDPNRSHLNYELTDRDRSVSYEKQIKNYVNETKISKRAIRKDAVLCDEWVITSDKKFFEDLNQEQVQEFFETAKKYFEEQYGKQNIAYASVHLDESTPHMHMGVVPMKDGKLSSKAMFDREELKSIQDKLPKYMNEHGFEVERGELNSEKKHKTVAEFKQDMAVKELDEKLVSEYGAPEYINETTGEYYDLIEYHNFLEFPSEEQEGQIARETTYAEKIDWVKQHYQQALNKLESSQKLSEARISNLDQKIEEKTKELSKIDLETSQKLSELSELEEHVNILEPQKNSLEAKIEGLRNEIEQLGSISDSELDSIRPKKGILGSKVELSPEQWSDFKGSYYKARNETREMKQLTKLYAQKIQLLTNGNGFQNGLNKAKNEVKDRQIKNLENALKDKDKTISVLEQKNKKLLEAAKQYMPQKLFQSLLEELQMIKPIVKVVRTVKSLFRD
ncbi:Plasmid recombination enzyme [Streptococcus infantarius subsp. infantarius]|nr:Plasmid recombination enzyme [Streptococcus infantarius subsp. infantarius]